MNNANYVSLVFEQIQSTVDSIVKLLINFLELMKQLVPFQFPVNEIAALVLLGPSVKTPINITKNT